MNTIIRYLQKYSSPSHVIFLLAVGIAGLIKPSIIGAAQEPWLPYVALAIAAIEVIAIKTRPNTLTNDVPEGYNDTLIISWVPGEDITPDQIKQIDEFEETLIEACEASGIAVYDTTDSIDSIDFTILTSDARTLIGKLGTVLERSKLRPLTAAAYRLEDAAKPEEITEIFQRQVKQS